MYTLPPLPYSYDALEPHISEETLRLHHDVLQRRYVRKLNELVSAPVPLETLIREAPAGTILDNASQIWNHTFFWNSMKPRGAGGPVLIPGWGSDPGLFESAFVSAATTIFGSGYVWLLLSHGRVVIWGAANAKNPLREHPNAIPLLCCDVWEHSYLLDYGADRGSYAKSFLRDLADWDFLTRIQ